MHRPCCQIECSWVEQQESSAAGGDGGEFGEADVVADGEADLAVGGDVYQGELVSGREDLAFLEGDFAGDVDIEEVELAVGGEEFALRAEEQAGVVVFLGLGDVFGDGAAEEVGRGLGGEGG